MQLKNTYLFCLIILFITNLFACDFFKTKKIQKHKLVNSHKNELVINNKETTKKVVTVLHENKPEPQKNEVNHCLQFLNNHPAVEEVGQVQANKNEFIIVIESNTVIDEISLTKWLSGFAHELYVKNRCEVSVSFTAHVNEYSYLQGNLRYSDFKLYQKQKISEAEWVKRFELKKLATSEATKKKIYEARKLGDLGEALKLTNLLLDDDYTNVAAQVLKANIYLDQKLYVEAIQIYEDVLKQQTNNVISLFNLSYAQKMVGRFTDAIQTTKTLWPFIKDNEKGKGYLKKLGLSKSDIWLHLAECYLKNNQLDKAKEALENVNNKKSIVYALLKANLLRLQKNPEGSKLVLVDVLDTGELQDIVLFNLAALAIDLKDEAGAKQYYHMLKEAYPQKAKELNFLLDLKKEESLPSNATTETIQVMPAEPEVDKAEPLF